ncbi:MAG: YraN family protein [Dehalococcoidia bacterium]|nr:YraN family protein [Dehalococcoidia bacterium]
MNRRELGALGEKLAQDFLKKRGYRILATNVRSREGELDIVAEKGRCLVFVEVRTRNSRSFGTPEESVTSAKRDKLVGLALAYMQDHPPHFPDWRIDVVAIEMDEGKVVRLELIENAVQGKD